MKIKKFKIRASAAGKLSFANKITDKQLIEIETLQNKPKLTEKQGEKLESLIEKRDTKELSQGAKTYCQKWLMDEIYGRYTQVSSKYLTKGIEQEDAGIERYNNMFNTFASKNAEQFNNEYATGEPDVILPKKINDIKNSYSHDTFPLFDKDINNPDYIDQLQVYMWLTGRKEAELVYVLENLPDELIEMELNKLGLEFTEENAKRFMYDDIEDKFRIKVFPLSFNQEYINELIDLVKHCRIYINNLINNL